MIKLNMGLGEAGGMGGKESMLSFNDTPYISVL